MPSALLRIAGASGTQGETCGFALLGMEIEVPDGLDVPSLV